jgi:hypothetical protein
MPKARYRSLAASRTWGGNASLSDSKIASGLKEALSVGTKNAVHLVDKPGGYLDNPAIKILLPKSLQPVESVLRGAGEGPKIDGFVSSMNHAAEQIFADAVTAMTIDDARKLLNGGDTSITEYFKSKTSTQRATGKRHPPEPGSQNYRLAEGSLRPLGQVCMLPLRVISRCTEQCRRVDT